MIRVIAFDADDTLWHNEVHFRSTEAAFRELLRPYHDEAWIDARLLETEVRNLRRYGYGVKSFVLSMIETALELTEGRVRGWEIQRILEWGREMLDRPVEPLPHVEACLRALVGRYRLWIVTKGDLLDQETKVARSGLGDFFEEVIVVTEKDVPTYRELLERRSVDPSTFLMVGNSLKSDVLPVLELGGRAVQIPYPHTWVHEAVTGPVPSFPVLEHLGQLPRWLEGA